jgi:bifunctional oligoribonuclease and PAP phosphatase NrnA
MIGSYKKTIQTLLKADTIAITGHINPDGDSIGALLSLGLAMKKIGKTVYFISQDRIPRRYHSLPGIKYLRKTVDKAVDLAVSVDCGNIRLLGPAVKIFQRAKNTLSIDHHKFRQEYANENLNDTEAASVGEMVYRVVTMMRIPLDKEIATNILTSLIVETNSFRLPTTSTKVFQICAWLLETGVDYYHISQVTYWSKTKAILKLYNLFYSKIQFVNSKLVWVHLTKADFRKTNTDMEDADPLIEELRSLENTQLAILFREESRKWLRVGLRSKGNINIASLAEEYEGGGHFDSAGCLVPNRKGIIGEIVKKAKLLL